MAELLEKAFAFSITALLLAAGFKAAQTALIPLVSTAAMLIQYNALADKLRQALQNAEATPLRLKFEASLPEGLSISGDGKDLVLEMNTNLGKRTDIIQTSMDVTVLRSVATGAAVITVDSNNGHILVEIGGG